MNKYLVGIPVLHGVEHTREAIESCIHEQSDVLVIDNGSDDGVKGVIKTFAGKVDVIINEKNIYVNPAWNQILKRFIDNEQYTHVILFNSDAILPPNYPHQLDRFYKLFPSAIPVPYETHDKRFAWQEQDINSQVIYHTIFDGIRGTCIILTREQAEKIYPIPDGIRVWFGDNWIYESLRSMGHGTLRLDNIIVYHALSQNVSITPSAIPIIDEDKKWWEFEGKAAMQRVVNKYETLKTR